MFKKIFMLLMVLVCLSGSVLTVNAKPVSQANSTEAVEAEPKEIKPAKVEFDKVESATDDPQEDGQWIDPSKFGFHDGIVWGTSIYEGNLLDDIDLQLNIIANMKKINVLSAELESGKFYTVVLNFFVEIDTKAQDKYKDVYLQVRYPNVLFSDSVNAVGSAVHGDKITTISDSFGITSQEDLALYCIEDTAELSSPDTSIPLTSEGAIVLFADERGIPLHNMLSQTFNVKEHKVAVFDLKFLLYAAPLGADVILKRGDSELTYWAGRKLMCDTKETAAPQGHMPYIATMDENDNVSLPEEKKKKDSQFDPWSKGVIVIAACGAFILGIIIICASVCNKGQRASFFADVFAVLAFNPDDDDDDFYDDEGDDEDEGEGKGKNKDNAIAKPEALIEASIAKDKEIK